MMRLPTLAVSIVLLGAIATAAGVQAGKIEKKQPQVVKLSFDTKGYVVTPPTVTKGVPVKMEVDLNTVKGCMRTVVINAFDVKKTVKAGDTTIEFTPSKSGPIEIVCGMNMGKGSFTVVETSGTKQAGAGRS
ncbi:MAG TPA: cupredoxin domain-containing protein [Vicinamibacterales bacterium]